MTRVMDDHVGRVGRSQLRVHPLVLDDLHALLMSGQSETIMRQRFGHQDAYFVPLQSTRRHVVQLLRRRRQHVLLFYIHFKIIS